MKSIRIKGYGRFVGKLLKYRYRVVLAALVLIVCSYASLPLIGMEFMPKADSKELNVKLTLEPGTRLQSTDYAAASIEQMIRNLGGEDIAWMYTLVGPSHTDTESGTQAKEENQAEIKVKLKPAAKIDADYLIMALGKHVSMPEGVELTYEKEQSALQTALGTEGAPLVVEIRGEEIEILEELCVELKQKLGKVKGLYEINTSMEKGSPEVNVALDRLRSGIYEVDIASVTQQISEQLNGKKAGSYESQGELVDIEIRVPEISLADLQGIEIRQGDKKYRLGEIAEIAVTTAPKEMIRKNQNRVGEVTAMLEKDYSLGRITPAVRACIAEMEFPAKYLAKITGEEEKRAESFNGLGFALILSIVLVYMVMAAQFESLRHPFTILLTIPLAGVGSILAFLITGQTLNMMAFIGIIMLAGIAVNSSIILVDRINQLKAQGFALKEAVMQAAQQRIRPIIMTSLTTILALLPMCFGFGEGASLRSPMALAVIGGLLTSTLLTLIVIPCVYYIFDRKPESLKREEV